MLASYNGRAVIGDSLTDVISRLFPGFSTNLGDRVGGTTQTTSPGTTVPGATTVPGGTQPPVSGTPAELLAQAEALFAEADAALAKNPPDFATYQTKQAQARELVAQALGQLGQ